MSDAAPMAVEPEHGMHIVLRHGNLVTKVVPYADASLENVIYRGT